MRLMTLKEKSFRITFQESASINSKFPSWVKFCRRSSGLGLVWIFGLRCPASFPLTAMSAQPIPRKAVTGVATSRFGHGAGGRENHLTHGKQAGKRGRDRASFWVFQQVSHCSSSMGAPKTSKPALKIQKAHASQCPSVRYIQHPRLQVSQKEKLHGPSCFRGGRLSCHFFRYRAMFTSWDVLRQRKG